MNNAPRLEPGYREFRKYVGSRIKLARLARRYSIATMAYITGLSTSFVQNIEKGRRCPSLRTAFAIVTALRIDIREVIPPALPKAPIRRRRNRQTIADGRVIRKGTSQRTKYRNKARERGMTYPPGLLPHEYAAFTAKIEAERKNREKEALESEKPPVARKKSKNASKKR